MTKALTPTEKVLKIKVTTQKRHQNLDNTTIADILRTVSWSNDSHATDVVNSVYGIPAFRLTAKAMQSKGHTFKKLLIILLRKTENQQPTTLERP